MIRKGELPELEKLHTVDPLIATYFQFTQLKQLYRQGWLQAGVNMDHCETVAEHSMGVMLLTALLGQQMDDDAEFDLEKALLMALFHDFGEIYAGDFTPLDEISPEKKHALELDAMQRVFKGLGESENILKLWEEFEDGKTVEARFVKQLDRLEMGLQASVYQHAGRLKCPETFIASMLKDIKNPGLRKIAEEVEGLTRRG